MACASGWGGWALLRLWQGNSAQNNNGVLLVFGQGRLLGQGHFSKALLARGRPCRARVTHRFGLVLLVVVLLRALLLFLLLLKLLLLLPLLLLLLLLLPLLLLLLLLPLALVDKGCTTSQQLRSSSSAAAARHLPHVLLLNTAPPQDHHPPPTRPLSPQRAQSGGGAAPGGRSTPRNRTHAPLLLPRLLLSTALFHATRRRGWPRLCAAASCLILPHVSPHAALGGALGSWAMNARRRSPLPPPPPLAFSSHAALLRAARCRQRPLPPSPRSRSPSLVLVSPRVQSSGRAPVLGLKGPSRGARNRRRSSSPCSRSFSVPRAFAPPCARPGRAQHGRLAVSRRSPSLVLVSPRARNGRVLLGLLLGALNARNAARAQPPSLVVFLLAVILRAARLCTPPRARRARAARPPRCLSSLALSRPRLSARSQRQGALGGPQRPERGARATAVARRLLARGDYPRNAPFPAAAPLVVVAVPSVRVFMHVRCAVCGVCLQVPRALLIKRKPAYNRASHLPRKGGPRPVNRAAKAEGRLKCYVYICMIKRRKEKPHQGTTARGANAACGGRV